MEVIGSFRDYDGLVDGLRARAASVGLSYELIEDLAEMSSGALSKYLSDLRCEAAHHRLADPHHRRHARWACGVRGLRDRRRAVARDAALLGTS